MEPLPGPTKQGVRDRQDPAQLRVAQSHRDGMEAREFPWLAESAACCPWTQALIDVDSHKSFFRETRAVSPLQSRHDRQAVRYTWTSGNRAHLQPGNSLLPAGALRCAGRKYPTGTRKWRRSANADGALRGVFVRGRDSIPRQPPAMRLVSGPGASRMWSSIATDEVRKPRHPEAPIEHSSANNGGCRG